MITIAEALKNLQTAIRLHYDEPENTFAALELLSEITNKSKPQLLTSLQSALPTEDTLRLSIYLCQIAKRIPLQYILGYTQFYGNKFKVSKDVLIPRPETEILVETAISHLLAKALSSQKPLNILDIGTGSGAITISIVNTCSRLLESPKQLTFYATDLSNAALRAVKDNSTTIIGEKNWLKQIHFLHADLYPPASTSTPQRFNIIAANLPYLSTDEFKTLKVHIRKYEPKEALVGGKTGTELVEKMLNGLQAHLAPGGVAIIELPPAHANWLRTTCKSLGFTAQKADRQGFIWTVLSRTIS